MNQATDRWIGTWSGGLVIAATAALTALGLGWLAGGPTILGLPLLFWLASIAIGLQWVCFLPSYLYKTDHYFDLVGSLSYILLVLLSLAAVLDQGALGQRQLLMASMVCCWALRLGSFLFLRVKRVGKDGRFDQIKQSAPRFLVAWSIQGLWVFITPLAALIVITSPIQTSLGLLDAIGLSLWVIGFGIEVVADAQKSAFRVVPKNTNRFIATGLWSWSRHPNYFGEILLWVGIAIIGSGLFHGGQWVGLLSPLLVSWLLIGVSGIPLLEARADEKWANNPDYLSYKQRTSVLIPRPPRD